jgi:hypothetical protein
MSRVRVEAARCEALFASSLQGSQHPDPEQVREAVARAIRSFGLRGCCGQVAQEFGDHPETAAARMRWAREAVSQAYPALARPRSWALTCGLSSPPSGLSSPSSDLASLPAGLASPPVETLPVEMPPATSPASSLDPEPAAA